MEQQVHDATPHDATPATIAAASRGLTEREAAERRARGQGNTAPPPTGRTYRQIIVENLFTFINLVLFGLGFALVLLGQISDALISTGVILLNVLVSVVQEVRAKRTLDRIALLTRPSACVLRDGRERQVAPEWLVIGDVLRLGPGDQIVLDGRVVGNGALSVDESQLTGESDLIQKRGGDPVFSGSFCVAGTGLYEVEKVGLQSLANQVTAGARSFRRVLTPLQRQIYLVIRIVLLIVIYLEFLVVLHSLQSDIGLAQGVQNSTIVASLVPNGLFLSISVAYAVAAVRIIRFGALVQQANAVESLSDVDMLCMDKTGTLTANRLQLAAIYPLAGDEQTLRAIIGTMAASATTRNKTADAILAASPAQAQPTIAEVPFSSTRKWSAVAFDNPPATQPPATTAAPPLQGVYVLGAPEMLRRSLAPETDWDAIAARIATLAASGLRVLLVAHAPDSSLLRDDGDASTLPGAMEALGLLSLSDELRPEAAETLRSFIHAGVRPKIISGDNPETVAALAKQAGLGPDIHLVSGAELDAMDDATFAATAADATIFGRTTPKHKERLIRALRADGHYVAMIGDGVNDVLSLKQANLAIAMHGGSQAARGVADIVLMNDSFAAIVPAVEEGQRIVNGMQDILKLFLARISTVGLIIVSSLVLGTFPLALRQGSVVTLFAVGIPTVLIAFWAQPGPTRHHEMLRQLIHFVLTPVVVSGALGLLLLNGVLYLEVIRRIGPQSVATPGPEQAVALYDQVLPTAQTALATFLVYCGLFLVIFVQPPTPWWTGGDRLSGDWRPTILAIALMAAFFVLDSIPALGNLFALIPLGPLEWGIVAGATLLWLLLVRWMWRGKLIERFVGTTWARDARVGATQKHTGG